MEPMTTLAVLGGALGTANLVGKILGPTADYLGGGVCDYTKNRITNLSRIFEHAGKTLGGKIEEPGQVPPRVLKCLLEEGSFCEDELSAKYFGGVLASSRSGVSRDDRAASLITAIGRLSIYQIRTHFIFYSLFKRECDGLAENLGVGDQRARFKLFIPFETYLIAMDFQEGESPMLLVPHVMNGLDREGLIATGWAMGDKETLKRYQQIDVVSGGIVFSPSAPGLELYLWAHGRSDVSVSQFLLTQFSPIELPGLVVQGEVKCYGP